MTLRRRKSPVNEIMDDFFFPEKNTYPYLAPAKKNNRLERILLPFLSLLHLIQKLFPSSWKFNLHLNPYRTLQQKLKLKNAYASIRRNVFKDPRYNYAAYIDQFQDTENQDNADSWETSLTNPSDRSTDDIHDSSSFYEEYNSFLAETFPDHETETDSFPIGRRNPYLFHSIFNSRFFREISLKPLADTSLEMVCNFQDIFQYDHIRIAA